MKDDTNNTLDKKIAGICMASLIILLSVCTLLNTYNVNRIAEDIATMKNIIENNKNI